MKDKEEGKYEMKSLKMSLKIQMKRTFLVNGGNTFLNSFKMFYNI